MLGVAIMLSARLFRSSFVLLGSALLTVTLGGVAAQGTSTSDLRARLTTLLPDNGQGAQVMDLVRDPDIVALEKRLVQAINQDPRWYNDYVREHKGSADLPWSPKFGLTTTEWQTIRFDNGKRFVRASPPEVARLAIQKSGNRLSFTGGAGAEDLRGLSLDLTSGELRTPEGFTAKPYVIDITIKNGRDKNGYVDAFGQSRKGYGWKIDGENSTTRVLGYFYLFQLANGSVVLSYNRVAVRNNVRLPEVFLTLMFEKRAAVSKRTN